MLVYICTGILRCKWYIILSGNISLDKLVALGQTMVQLSVNLVFIFHVCKIDDEPREDAFLPLNRDFSNISGLSLNSEQALS